VSEGGPSDTREPRSNSAQLTVLSKDQVAQIVALADASPKATIPDRIPESAVRQPWWHPSDVQAVVAIAVFIIFVALLCIKVYECHLVCRDERDWDQVLEPFVTAGVLGIGSVIGYFFGRKPNE
jgi:hypothetical protein